MLEKIQPYTPFLKRFDLFLFECIPRHVKLGVGYGSWLGLAATVCLVSIVVAYASFSFNRFLNVPPAMSVRQTPTELESNPILRTCISLPHLNDTRWWGLTAKRVDLNLRGRKAAETPLKFTWSTSSADTGSLPVACLVAADNMNKSGRSNAYIKSYCDPGLCSVIRVKLYPCGVDSSKNPARDASQCVAADRIVRVLERNYVVVDYVSPLEELGTKTLFLPPKLNASMKTLSQFAINNTISPPDMLRTFSESKMAILMHDATTSDVQRYFHSLQDDQDFSVLHDEVLEINLAMSAHTIETTKSVLTSIDMLSLIGAFGSLLSSIIGFLVWRVNRHFFYKDNPHWAHVSAEFTVDREELKQAVREGEHGSYIVNSSPKLAEGDGSSSTGSLLTKVRPAQKKVRFSDNVEDHLNYQNGEVLEMNEQSGDVVEQALM